VSGPVEEGVTRAHQELAAARLPANNGFGAQAVSRSYYAAFYAAESALLQVGETRERHSGVVSAVARLLVREGTWTSKRAGCSGECRTLIVAAGARSSTVAVAR
jgi:uncharacterized protein (UPF0332 family)